MTQKKESHYGISKYEKFTNNPFIEKAIETVKGNIVKRYRTSSGTDQKAILQAVDPETGEMLGHTSFIRQIEVDEDKFTKVYLAQFSAFWDLGKQAIRVFGYIMTKLIPKQDLFIFLMEECKDHTGYKSDSSVFIGLNQLLKAEIIARGPADSLYFINPLVAFNGDRVTYAKTYVKKKKVQVDPNQISLLDEPGMRNE